MIPNSGLRQPPFLVPRLLWLRSPGTVWLSCGCSVLGLQGRLKVSTGSVPSWRLWGRIASKLIQVLGRILFPCLQDWDPFSLLAVGWGSPCTPRVAPTPLTSSHCGSSIFMPRTEHQVLPRPQHLCLLPCHFQSRLLPLF